MSLITEKSQQEIIDDFLIFDDWMEKYQYIIDLGKSLDKLDDEDKIEANKLQGCQSQVWIVHNYKDGLIHFKAESDAAIVSGLVALVLSIYSEKTPQFIIENDPEFISEIGLDKHLSPTRSNGLSSLIAKIKSTAEIYSKTN